MRNDKRFICVLLSVIFIAISGIGQVTITMEKKGDVFYIPGKINNLPLKFIFDTGASNVYISLTEALFMLKNGYLSDSDFGNTSYAQIANGAIVENTEVLLKEIEIGPVKINNVKAMVSNTLEAPLLLGQSAIQKLGPIQLDGRKLIISNGKDLVSDNQTVQLYMQAHQAAEAGNYEEAISLSLKALEYTRNPQYRAGIYDNLAWAYNHSGQKDKAIDALNKALGEDFMAEQPAYNLGVYLYENGQVEEGLRAFNNFIERHPNPSNKSLLTAAYAYKGECHSSLGQVKDAEAAYKKSISLEPSSMAELGLADLYLNTRRYSDACPCYKDALSYEPYRMSNIKRWHQYGFCLINSNQPELARDAFKNCITAAMENQKYITLGMNEGDEDIQNQMAFFAGLSMNAQLWMARLATEPRRTISEYEQAYKLLNKSNDFEVRDYLIWQSAYNEISSSQTYVSKRKEILEKGLKQYPKNPDMLFTYSLLIGDTDPLSMEYLMEILSQEFSYEPLYFDYATVYNNIAWRFCLDHRYQEALPYAQTAVKLDSNHDYSWETIGEIYYNLGQYKDCIVAMTKCITLSPTKFKEAYELRAKSYEKLGMKKDAKKDFESLSKFTFYE